MMCEGARRRFGAAFEAREISTLPIGARPTEKNAGWDERVGDEGERGLARPRFRSVERAGEDFLCGSADVLCDSRGGVGVAEVTGGALLVVVRKRSASAGR